MKAPPLLVILLLAAIVLVDLAVWVMAGPSSWPDPAFILLWALAISQSSFLGFWLGMGKGPVLVRFLCVCAGVVLLSSLLPNPLRFLNSRVLPALFILVFIQAIVFFGLRIAGFRLELSGTIPGETDSSAASEFRVRYSIWNIIEWTICVAIFLALFRALDLEWTDLLSPLSAVIYFSAISAIAFPSAWAILRARRLWLWFVVIGELSLLFGGISGFRLSEFILVVLYTLLLLGMFLVLRASGYRIIRVGSATDDSLAGNGNEPETAE